MSDTSAADRIYADGEVPEDADLNAPAAANSDGKNSPGTSTSKEDTRE
jgi:hypothetical protein